MKEQVKCIIFDFKDKGWSVQKIELELKFSNGSLGKVVSGQTNLSDYRYCKLLELHEKEIGKTVPVTKELNDLVLENNKPENKKKIIKQRDKKTVAKTIFPKAPSESYNGDVPKRLEGEKIIDYKIRCIEIGNNLESN